MIVCICSTGIYVYEASCALQFVHDCVIIALRKLGQLSIVRLSLVVVVPIELHIKDIILTFKANSPKTPVMVILNKPLDTPSAKPVTELQWMTFPECVRFQKDMPLFASVIR